MRVLLFFIHVMSDALAACRSDNGNSKALASCGGQEQSGSRGVQWAGCMRFKFISAPLVTLLINSTKESVAYLML